MRRISTDQALYSVTELAHLCGVSRYRMRRMLRQAGNVLPSSGQAARKKQMVSAVALRAAFPELWQSLVLRYETRGEVVSHCR